ncbi:response regulator [Micromonospora sp. M12]
MANPVILSVDDDPWCPGRWPATSGAATATATGCCGLLRAGGPGRAAEVKLRGEQVALLLADHRMPQMTGVEFLEAAMDIFPAARRVLLTAYADTDAAIEAINVVDLDHYLLKPWHPPEEKLYPVVDGLLEAWAVTPDAASGEIRVVGHRWSAPSFKVRDFLARNLVPYRWLLSDDPEGARLLDAAGATEADVPLVVTPEGKALVAPARPSWPRSPG